MTPWATFLRTMKVRQLFTHTDFENISRQHSSADTHRVLGQVALPMFEPSQEHNLNDGLLGKNVSQEPVILEWLSKTHPDIEHVDVKWLKQPPGTTVPDHYDRDGFWLKESLPADIDPDVKDVVRRLVFVTDWEPGQEWRFENNKYTGWKAGTCVEWAWWAKHGTSNDSSNNRINIKLTAVRKGNY